MTRYLRSKTQDTLLGIKLGTYQTAPGTICGIKEVSSKRKTFGCMTFRLLVFRKTRLAMEELISLRQNHISFQLCGTLQTSRSFRIVSMQTSLRHAYIMRIPQGERIVYSISQYSGAHPCNCDGGINILQK